MQDRNPSRRQFLEMAAAAFALRGVVRAQAAARPPNVVIVYADDLGYGDLGCFGAREWETPHLDRMAAEGRRFTDFHVAQAVCSASRTGLLTGCYPNRIGILGALGPNAEHGIDDGEATIAEVVKQGGYATAIYGKWHLGHHPQFLPPRHGFDEYFGLPYSNDMGPLHPDQERINFPAVPLIEGDKVIAYNPDFSQLTTWYTERAVGFIERNKDRPFLLYVPHTMPHVPLFVSEKFKGKSKRGVYGDVIEEIDWSVGQILAAIARCGLDERTWVIFASDNGPWLSYGDHAGSSGPLREGKGTTWEGGVRTPCVMRWPGTIPAKTTCVEPIMTIDLLPTIAGVAGAALPRLPIDGKDVLPLVAGAAGAFSPHEAYYFYWGEELQAVRSGPWKLHLPHGYPGLLGRPGGTGGKPVAYTPSKTPLALYDLGSDVAETTDVAAQHPDAVARLTDLGKRFDESLKRGKRAPGKLQ